MVLDNLLGITDAVELAHMEEKISKKAALSLFDGALDQFEPGTFKCLSFIHKTLFQEIYAFAGNLREVNIAKANFRFASVMYLDQAIKAVEVMSQNTFEEIIEKYVEMNVAHPFREGNGRSMRIWLDHILKHQIARVIDWSKVNPSDYLLAMERSPIKDLEIKSLLRSALTADIENRLVYMKGLDASYRYEGYTAYKTEDLD